MNPNYIKLIGVAKIKFSSLISSTDKFQWVPIYAPVKKPPGRGQSIATDVSENRADEPIGKLNIESNFI